MDYTTDIRNLRRCVEFPAAQSRANRQHYLRRALLYALLRTKGNILLEQPNSGDHGSAVWAMQETQAMNLNLTLLSPGEFLGKGLHPSSTPRQTFARCAHQALHLLKTHNISDRPNCGILHTGMTGGDELLTQAQH